jgi:membrane protein
LLKDTFSSWSEDKATRLGAALAYYSVFSIGPLILLATGVAGLFFERQDAQDKVLTEIRHTMGEPVAKGLESTLVQGNKDKGLSAGATIIGLVALIFGAAGVFGQLQDALNTVWKVAPKPGRGLWGIIRDRFLSLTMVFGVGFLLLVSLLLSAALSALGEWISGGRAAEGILWQALNQLISFGVVTLLFAMMYRLLPDAEIGWRDVWIGAVLTALLFTLGKFLLGLYLGREGAASGFGAAGSLVLILLWVYYSSLIFLFGAEFTYVYAKQYGSGVKPSPEAVRVDEKARSRQGLDQGSSAPSRGRAHPA